MNLLQTCKKCKGKGKTMGGGYMIKNCPWCGGKGHTYEAQESNHIKMCNNVVIINESKKKSKDVDLTELKEDDIKSKLAEMSDEDLNKVVKKKRGRPKKVITD